MPYYGTPSERGEEEGINSGDQLFSLAERRRNEEALEFERHELGEGAAELELGRRDSNPGSRAASTAHSQEGGPAVPTDTRTRSSGAATENMRRETVSSADNPSLQSTTPRTSRELGTESATPTTAQSEFIQRWCHDLPDQQDRPVDVPEEVAEVIEADKLEGLEFEALKVGIKVTFDTRVDGMQLLEIDLRFYTEQGGQHVKVGECSDIKGQMWPATDDDYAAEEVFH